MDEELAPPTRYVLPDHLRSAVAGGYGTLLQTDEVADLLAGSAPIVAVGDVVSMTLHGLGIQPTAFVCDYKTQRGENDPDFLATLGQWGDREIRVDNPAATITRGAWLAVREAIADEGLVRIVVEGEEDLLGIPAFLETPLGGVVLYGKPGKGLVAVTIDEAFQAKVRDIVARMDRE